MAPGVAAILDPRAEAVRQRGDRGPDAGPLAGKRVGLRRDEFWESWDVVTDEWSAQLRELGAEPVIWRAPVAKGEAAVAGGEEFNRFLEDIDVLIVGLCNCGSCSLWAIHDALAGLDRDLPTVTVATAHFERLARTLADQGGRADIRLVVLPYPLEGQAPEAIREIAHAEFETLLSSAGATRDAAPVGV